MFNLFEGVKKISRRELEEEIASFEVYQLNVAIRIIGQSIIYGIVKMTAFFLDIFKIKISIPIVKNMELRKNNIMDEVRLLDDDQRDKRLTKQLKWCIFKSKMILPLFIKNEDQLSNLVTKSARSLFHKDDIYSMSVTEMNEYIFAHYHTKRKLEKKP